MEELAKGCLWVNLSDSQSLEGAETPGVTRSSVSYGQEGQTHTKIFALHLLAPREISTAGLREASETWVT